MKIFDIEIAMSDTGFLDILQVRHEENIKLKLMKQRKEKDENIKLQQDKITEAQKQMDEYKNKTDKPYPVKAFVTFHSIEAANKLKHLYNDPCCLCCTYEKYKDRQYFYYANINRLVLERIGYR